MVTLKDIAQHAGVSVSAASMALRDHASISFETKQRVLKATEVLGYRPRRKATGNIAFLLCDRAFDIPVYARTFQAVTHAASKANLQPIYLSTTLAEITSGELPGMLKRREVEGVVLSGVYDEAAHEQLKKLKIPIVALGNYHLGDKPWAACEADLFSGMGTIIRRLVSFGHERVGLLIRSNATGYGRKLEWAFREHVAEQGIQNACVEVEGTDEDASCSESTRRAVLRAIESPICPTALVVERAIVAVYTECAKLGLSIPGDLSIISFGDPGGVLHPSLARVEVNFDDYGQTAIEKLIRLIENPGACLTRELFPMHYHEGESVAAPARNYNTGKMA